MQHLRLSFLFLAGLTLFLVSEASAQWIALDTGTSTTLNAAKAISQDVVVAVGDDGIIRTNDGGQSWTRSLTTDYRLNGIDGDGDFLFAVGNHGTIFASLNGGVSWVEQSSGTTRNLRDVHVFRGKSVHTAKAVAVGGLGTILRTENTGEVWLTQPSVISDSLNGVHFVGRLNGWIVGDRGRVMHTNDGGVRWVTVSTNPGYNLTGIAADTNGHAWAVGTNATILSSTDDGASWTPLSLSTTEDLRGAHFGNTRLRVVGMRGTILESRRDGTSFMNDARIPGVEPPNNFVRRTNLRGITNTSGHWYAVGDRGTVWKFVD